MASKKKPETETVTISQPRMHVLTQRIVGTSPYVQARFAEKARHAMREKQEAGSTAKKGRFYALCFGTASCWRAWWVC